MRKCRDAESGRVHGCSVKREIQFGPQDGKELLEEFTQTGAHRFPLEKDNAGAVLETVTGQ